MIARVLLSGAAGRAQKALTFRRLIAFHDGVMITMLRHTLTVTRRELGELFASPVFYVVAALFHFVVGAFFVQILVDMMDHVTDPYKRSAFRGELNLTQFVLVNIFDIASFLLLFIIPVLTMRLIAEERRSGMFELLTSTPVGDRALVLGKWLASWLTTGLLGLSVLVYPLMASRLGAVEWGVVGVATLALLLMGGAFCALGLFASSLTDQPVIAAVLSMGALMLFAFMAYMGPADSGSLLGNTLRGFSFGMRQRELFGGTLRGEDVLYFVMFASLFLFATWRVLEARRWQR